MQRSVTFATFLLLLLSVHLSWQQCRDESGGFVDWFVIYKLPKNEKHHQKYASFIDDGLGHVYLDAHDASNDWSLSKLSIGDSRSSVGRTLASLYEDSHDSAYVMYNDEHPDGNTSFTDGHTKGVIAFGPKTGFWLVHSVPKYPPPPSAGSYGYPHTGQMYGQSFLCISLNTKASLDKIGMQLLYNRPYIYAKNLPAFSQADFPHFKAALDGVHVKKPPFYRTQELVSEGGTRFISFAKTAHFEKDLYADLVAPMLKTDLLVETWPNGRGRMNSSCSLKFKVENVDAMAFNKVETFASTHDHSKWGIASQEKETSHVCIGDINRMESQKKRGGGTVCFVNKYAWTAFNRAIKSVEKCAKDRPKFWWLP